MADSMNTGPTGVRGVVIGRTQSGIESAIANARVSVQLSSASAKTPASAAQPPGVITDAKGHYFIHCDPVQVTVLASAFGSQGTVTVEVPSGGVVEAPPITVPLSFDLKLRTRGNDPETINTVLHAVVGEPMLAYVDDPTNLIGQTVWCPPPGARSIESADGLELRFEYAGKSKIEATLIAAAVSFSAAGQAAKSGPLAEVNLIQPISVSEAPVRTIGGDVRVRLQRAASEPTLDEALWHAIRDRTHAISFERYRKFLNRVLLWEENAPMPGPIERRLRDLGAHLHGTGAYQVLKTATEVFLLLECGVRVGRHHHDEFATASQAGAGRRDCGELAERLSQYLGCPPQLPYIRRVVEAAFPQYELSAAAGHRLLVDKINEPCLLELIWSYWHEEGMLMQTINAITRRFQNVRKPGDRDPLLNVEIDPLRPANNILWGYVQDEPNRLTVARRASEYAHEYGLALYGKALPSIQPVDTRSKFLEAFHNLLYQSSVFFKEDAQTTVIADGYPLLNALKDVHLILAQGAHNEFGDLPWTARAEMLLVQFVLGRPEIRDFLQSRAMVPYREPWMPQVDAMKTLQGWTDVTVTHFRDLGVYGEQILLSVRYGDWTNVDNEDSAKNWARFHKEILYAYWNAHRAVTGIDLTNPDTVDSTLPAILLQRRLAVQQQRVR
jgi:hypothetical protein